MISAIIFASPVAVFKMIKLHSLTKPPLQRGINFIKSMYKSSFIYSLLSAPVD